ncbi:hypothetical protein FOL47_001405, partial [Perkinsus chesapeaki]
MSAFNLPYAYSMGVGQAQHEYACYVPAHVEEPIKCILAEVDSGVRYRGVEPLGPYVYSEHSLVAGENGDPVYKSKSCKIESDIKAKSMKIAAPCSLNGVREFNFMRGKSGYGIKPQSPSDEQPESYFTYVEKKDISDPKLCKWGKKYDVIAEYVSDSSEGTKWRANLTLGERKASCFGKRELRVGLSEIVNGQETRLPTVYKGDRMFFGFLLTGYLAKLETRLNKGMYALLVYGSSETYLLFDKDKMPSITDIRRGSEPDSPPARPSLAHRHLPPPPPYDEAAAAAADAELPRASFAHDRAPPPPYSREALPRFGTSFAHDGAPPPPYSEVAEDGLP